MARNWFKLFNDLEEHPKIERIADELDCEIETVIGSWVCVLSRFDKHSDDGVLSTTPKALQRRLSLPGVVQALIDVGWLAETEDGCLTMPNFEKHNGDSAKKRGEGQLRKAKSRQTAEKQACPQSVRDLSARRPAKSEAREEKRREESVSGTGTGSDGASPPLMAGDEPGEEKTNGSQRSGSVFEHLTEESLRDETAFANWFRSQATSAAPVYANNEAGFRLACQACEQSLRKGRKPVSMFVRLTTNDKPLKVVKDAEMAAEQRVQNATKRKELSNAG